MATLYGDHALTAKSAKAFFPTMEDDLLEASLQDDIKQYAMLAKDLSVAVANSRNGKIRWSENKLLAKPTTPFSRNGDPYRLFG
jgi:hypothetical protein